MFARRLSLQPAEPAKAALTFVAGDGDQNSFVVSEMQIAVDLKQWVEWLETKQMKQVFALIVSAAAVSDLLEALEDPELPERNSARQLTEDGTALLDIFVERAKRIDRLPEDWEPDWIVTLRSEAERLHEAICEGRTDDADALLREMVPDQYFRPVKAQQWLAAARNGQASLL